ncbi:response regulator [Paenibacillus sp. 481]|uniref:response regulator n=1 Tax=Paenibacillus sp. 481 TaxID=2835869 RepID=UPI001E2C6B10|nr:response regulator transcription factor [Paenibacillus sp. 481]UHA73802.1 response regulator transcription factor [Paenibacillus sp. 481]
METPIKVLLVDDHIVVIRGLQFFLNMQSTIQVVGEATNGSEAIGKIEELRPDVVLMDLQMPGMNGIEATRHIRQQFPNTKVIMLTSFSEQDQVVPAIKAGANGYLLKDVQPDKLVEAIMGVMRGQAALHPSVTGQLMSHLVEKPADQEIRLDLLTARETEVLRFIALGRSNKEIAQEMTISEKTVKTHVSNLLSKLGMSARTQAAIYAVKQGILE